MPFSHEKLVVYQKSISFVAWAKQLQDKLPVGNSTIRNQLDRASISIPLNIAEGNGKRSYKDRARFLQIAQGSALECSACLDVTVAQGSIPSSETNDGKLALEQIVSMLHGLIEHCRDNYSVQEGPAEYGSKENIMLIEQEQN